VKTCAVAYLDAVLVDIDVVSSRTVMSLAEDNQLLKEKHVSQTPLTTVRHNELGLTQQ